MKENPNQDITNLLNDLKHMILIDRERTNLAKLGLKCSNQMWCQPGLKRGPLPPSYGTGVQAVPICFLSSPAPVVAGRDLLLSERGPLWPGKQTHSPRESHTPCPLHERGQGVVAGRSGCALAHTTKAATSAISNAFGFETSAI